MRLRSQIGITAVLTALFAAGWVWLAGEQEAVRSSQAKRMPASAAAVLIEPIKLREDRVIVRAIGTGEALKSASLFPTVAGVVTEVAFDAGQRVKEGTPLLRLDDRHQQLAVRLAEVAVAEAERQVKRLRRLAPRGAASIARLETADAALESAKLRLDQARVALRDRTLYAPFDGVVGMTKITKGDRVNTNNLITMFDDRSVILVEFNLPEEYAGRVKIGDKVKVRPWTMPEREMEGVVSARGSRIDPVSRSLRVKARIPNPDDVLRPGTAFKVELAFSGRAYPAVREVAVLWSSDGAYLWRIADGKAEKVFVSIVRRDGGRILVDGKLRAGDTVVVEGVQGLRIGQKVKTAPFPANDAGGALSAGKGGNS